MNEEFTFYKKELCNASDLNADLTDKLSSLSQQYVEIVEDYKQQINALKLKLHNATAATPAATSGSTGDGIDDCGVDLSTLNSLADCGALEKALQQKLEALEKRKVSMLVTCWLLFAAIESLWVWCCLYTVM